MADIVIPHRGSNQVSQSTAVGDTITVDTATRQRNVAAPLPNRGVLPSFAGNVAGRDWQNYMLVGLTGPCQGLYSGIPTLMQNPSTLEFFVLYQYQHSGNTSETALADAVTRNVFEGQRGDTLTSPYITAVPTPRATPLTSPTLWSCIDLGGWGFHITHLGRTITAYGKALPDGVFPKTDGSTKTLHGSFPDGYFNGPNDLTYDRSIPTIQYVADTFNNRIMKVQETSPGVVTVSLYYSGGLNKPYSLYAEADGTLIVADRENNRVLRIPQVGGPGGTAGTPVDIVTGLSQPMVVRPFSDGNICCAEFGGTRRLLEITRSNGALREITTIRTQQGVQGTAWLWMDVDDNGVLGPVDDIFTVLTSSFDTLRRTGRTDGYGTSNLAEGFVANGSHLTQGLLSQVQDPEGHYPWAVACSDTEPKLLVTGSGSQQAREICRIWPGAVTTPLTSTQKSKRSRGATIWSGINFNTTEPSFTLTAGHAGGHNFLGAPNKTTEQLDAMGWIEFAAWLRAGGNGQNPRTLTDVDVQDVKYYIKMNAVRGLTDSSIDAIGFEPTPPPDPPVFRDVVTGLDVTLISVEDPEPPEEEEPPVPVLAVGVRIEVNAGSALNVRSQMLFDPAQDSINIIGTQPVGAEGTVIGGTGQVVEGFPRWQVNFDTGVDGWVAGTRLDTVAVVPEDPPQTGEPGTWVKAVQASRTVYQPYLAGDQNLVEGAPGAAITVQPRPITTDGVMFRSFSGTAAGADDVWYIGGGHAGHPGNDFDRFDNATLTWFPTPFAAECPLPYNADGSQNVTWRGLVGGGVGIGGLSPTSRPWCNHTYRLHAVDTIRHRLLWISGQGLGAYSTAGVWTQLQGKDKAFNEVGAHSSMGMIFDPTGNGAVYVFASETSNGASRGIYKYTFASDGSIATKQYLHPWPSETDPALDVDSAGNSLVNWGFGSKLITAVPGPGRLVYLMMGPSGGTAPTIPYRLFTYNLDTRALIWDQTLIPGTAAYSGVFANGGTGRTWARRANAGQLYFRVANGFWIKTESTNTWAFTADVGAAPPRTSIWTLNWMPSRDAFIAIAYRTLYSGVGGARSSGGIADTWIYTPPEA